MNSREIAQIRRRIRPEKNNIGRIRGCYVGNKSISSEFNLNFGLISNDEAEELLGLLRKIFSGTIGRNLIDISFSNQQVESSKEHKLLMDLRSSRLGDDSTVKEFFNKAIENIDLEGSYLILLANDIFDIITYGEDGEEKHSEEVMSYFMCGICPVKAAKPSLGYVLSENKFKNFIRDAVVCPPEMGFMFPAFENKGANIYNALYYTKDLSFSHDEFTAAMFNINLPKPAKEQTESMAAMLSTALTEECDLDFVQAIQTQLVELTEDHKANKIDENLVLTVKDMSSLLRCGGADEEKIADFSEKFKESFGENAAVTPANVMNIKQMEVKTPEVTVKVNSDHNDFIETRVINGTKYILIRAEGDIEVNGIRINIAE